MSDDIVERLRKVKGLFEERCQEAADEIGRLRAIEKAADQIYDEQAHYGYNSFESFELLGKALNTSPGGAKGGDDG